MNRNKLQAWGHYTLVWLVGSILTALAAHIINRQFNHFLAFFIPAVMGSIVCWLFTRKDLTGDRFKQACFFLSFVMLFGVLMIANRSWNYVTGNKAKVKHLTAANIKGNQYLEVCDLELDTSRTATYIARRIEHNRNYKNLVFEGTIIIQVKGLKNIFIQEETQTSCNYDFSTEQKLEETYEEVKRRLNIIKNRTPLHSHCYLTKIDNKNQGLVHAAYYAGLISKSDFNKLAIYEITSSAGETPLWKNFKELAIIVCVWLVIMAAVFAFAKQGQDEETAFTKNDWKELFRLASTLWPTVAIALICVAVYIVELSMGYKESHPDGDILYRLGALEGFRTLAEGQWWHLLAYAFLHGSFQHLLGNVCALLMISFFMLENVKPIGQAGIFLASSLFSGLCIIVFSGNEAVGASGGVFGMAGAYLTLSVYAWIMNGQRSLGMLLIGVGCLVSLLLSFARSVSMAGHIGGLACGILIGIGIIVYKNSKNP